MSQLKTQKPVKRRIKEAVAALLLGKTQADSKVFISRSIPVQSEELPCILVYSATENIEQFNEAPKDYRRRLTLIIECIDAGDNDDDLDERVEKLAEIVETLMEVDETLGGLVNRLNLIGTDYQQEPDGESPMGSLILRYSVEFFTDAIRPGECLPDFKRSDIEWQVGHDNESSDNVIDAVDTLTIDQEE